jgi:hypothetical protein
MGTDFIDASCKQIFLVILRTSYLNFSATKSVGEKQRLLGLFKIKLTTPRKYSPEVKLFGHYRVNQPVKSGQLEPRAPEVIFHDFILSKDAPLACLLETILLNIGKLRPQTAVDSK